MADTQSSEGQIRQRIPTMPASAENAPLMGTTPVPRYQKAPPPAKRPTRVLHYSLAILILGFFVLYSQRTGSKRQLITYGMGSKGSALPETYGICTKDREGIYTVPEEGGVGSVECVVVSGKEVVDTGSLSES